MINRVAAMAGSVRHDELVDPALALEDLVWRLFHEEEVRVLPAEPIVFRCDCDAARIAAVDVVDDHRDDRWPAEQERADHGRCPERAQRQSQCMQRVNDMRRAHQRRRGLDGHQLIVHAARSSKVGQDIKVGISARTARAIAKG